MQKKSAFRADFFVQASWHGVQEMTAAAGQFRRLGQVMGRTDRSLRVNCNSPLRIRGVDAARGRFLYLTIWSLFYVERSLCLLAEAARLRVPEK